jgi:hypothetical protein
LERVRVPVRSNLVQIVEALLSASSLNANERARTLDRTAAVMAKRARPKKDKDGAGDVAEADDDEAAGEEQDDEDQEPDLSEVVIPDILQELAPCEVICNAHGFAGC